jgi:hypothetical protein
LLNVSLKVLDGVDGGHGPPGALDDDSYGKRNHDAAAHGRGHRRGHGCGRRTDRGRRDGLGGLGFLFLARVVVRWGFLRTRRWHHWFCHGAAWWHQSLTTDQDVHGGGNDGVARAELEDLDLDVVAAFGSRVDDPVVCGAAPLVLVGRPEIEIPGNHPGSQAGTRHRRKPAEAHVLGTTSPRTVTGKRWWGFEVVIDRVLHLVPFVVCNVAIGGVKVEADADAVVGCDSVGP